MKNSVRTQTPAVFVLTALLLGSVFLGGCLKREKDGVLARFGNRSVTAAEFRERLDGMPAEFRDVAMRNRKEFLDTMIDEHFLLEEARRRKLDRLADVRRLLDEAQKKILIAKLVELEVDHHVRLEEAEVKAYYDEHPDEFLTPLKLRASHILVRSRSEADSLRAQLTAGGSIEELARLHSTDRTASRGGDLGYFQRGQFIPAFEEVVFGMEPGQISPVFETQFGFHVVKLVERLDPKLRDFSSVRRWIEERLTREKRSKLYRDLVAGLRTGKKIEIEEEALEQFSAASNERGE